ncbi:Ubiquitin- modifier 1 [Coemansia aciculifera]|uniref:Ubiquitin- modifier 1 n=1 Tax=Coemansia aciculifera TaxID=417176 RepID=A0ACC1M2A6_9FUNG|nr:Ubiquitin- modifier 1 [Coemansia aciculifera]
MELLIQGKKQEIEHDFAHSMTMKDLIKYIGETHVLKGKEDAFTKAGTICPGILVIVNGSDWEVMDELDYQLENDDVVEFISTLHGG